MVSQLTLYSSKGSPYSQYVEIALKEAKAQYSRYEVDWMHNKPAWFAAQVNPAGKVPAITYGGPVTPPEQPSADSLKLAESMVLLEFVADLYPDAPILPQDPVVRASVRFFINVIATKFTKAYLSCLLDGEPPEQALDVIEDVQKLLPDEDKGKYAIGNIFTNADAVAAAWFLRLETYLRHDIGSYKEGDGKKAYEVLQQSPKYTRYRSYIAALRERESVNMTYDEAFLVKEFASYFNKKRA